MAPHNQDKKYDTRSPIRNKQSKFCREDSYTVNHKYPK